MTCKLSAALVAQYIGKLDERDFGGNQQMKRTMFQKALCLILSVTFILSTFVITASAAGGAKYKGDESTSSTLEEMKALVGTSSYKEYISIYSGLENPDDLDTIPISVLDFIVDDNSNGDVEITANSQEYKDALADAERYAAEWATFGDNANNSVYISTINKSKKASVASWTFNVPNGKAGFYTLQIEYYNCKTSESSVSAIQRKLLIDGKVPFSEVNSITFDKYWSYNNFTVSEPVPAPAGATVGTTTRYENVTKYSQSENDKNGYYKYETKVYEDNGQLMQVVTTYKISQDINGNSMSPIAAESSEWGTYICHDESGYHEGYFEFYLGSGTHTLTLESEREPVIIKSINFVPSDGDAASSGVPSYRDYQASHQDKAPAKGGVVKIEAEFPYLVSDSSVIGSNDNTSAVTYPISHKAQLFNVIGETGFSTVGQWAAYKFTVNQSGMYKLSMRYKQSVLQGMFVCRAIKLSGGSYGLSDGSAALPFAEAAKARFDYSKEWQSDYLGYYDENNEKNYFELYFEEGVEYTLYLECSLGDLKNYIEAVETSLANLNEAYLKIIQYTGSDPDVNAPYDFHKVLPEVLKTLLEEAVNLTRYADELEALCGTNGAHIATLDTVARVLLTMGKDHGMEIAANLSNFKSYLGTLGTWINDSKMGTLMVDNISVVPAGENDPDIPKAKANFFQSLWFEICSFIYSFFTDYDQMGVTSVTDDGASTIDVWLAMGRDQSQIWRTMIDSKGGFTDTYGTAVALKLVTGGTLLPSILSGKGPDVYLGLGAADVINYAIRNAVVGVSGNDPSLSDADNLVFSSYVYKNVATGEHIYKSERLTDEQARAEGLILVSNSFEGAIEGNFAPAAMKTLTIYSPKNEGKENPDITYGIPMTMGFAMMFYRMDILAELDQEVPETWDQLLEVLPVFQANNMEIGVTYINALDFMIYQMGGNMWKYTDPTKYESKYAGAKIDLDSDIALEAFDFVCRLYTDYSFPVSFDTANRFRTGEMPIVIGDYASIYNTLVVYATDISGLWEFSSLPGSVTRDDDGNVVDYNYDSLATVSATIILNSCDNMLAAWQFTQWQTSASVQATYGNRIVALIGPAAKYETANINAIEDLSWTANEKAAIANQMAHLNAIVNYPGSYYYSRYMKFAFLDVYNDNANPHDAMMSYIDAINSEIARKREEFGLPTVESADPEMIPQ